MLLACPECDAQVPVPQRKLAVGYSLRCPHCGADLYLDRLRDEPDARAMWQLQSREELEEERTRP